MIPVDAVVAVAVVILATFQVSKMLLIQLLFEDPEMAELLLAPGNRNFNCILFVINWDIEDQKFSRKLHRRKKLSICAFVGKYCLRTNLFPPKAATPNTATMVRRDAISTLATVAMTGTAWGFTQFALFVLLFTSMELSVVVGLLMSDIAGNFSTFLLFHISY